jgi:hypothetical protein
MFHVLAMFEVPFLLVHSRKNTNEDMRARGVALAAVLVVVANVATAVEKAPPPEDCSDGATATVLVQDGKVQEAVEVPDERVSSDLPAAVTGAADRRSFQKVPPPVGKYRLEVSCQLGSRWVLKLAEQKIGIWCEASQRFTAPVHLHRYSPHRS